MKADINDLIDQYTSSSEVVPIRCLPRGIEHNGVSMAPCIFIGPRGRPLLLYNSEVTLEILEKIFNKTLKDNNKKATIALLHYAVYNEKAFWQRYRETQLGTQVMAEILGQHE